MNVDLLKRLCETPGVPGREERVRSLIEKEVKGLFDSVETDAMGSLICRRKPRGKDNKPSKAADAKVVMLLCHMDEIGFYVSHVDDDGFLWVNNAGGFDTRNLFSRRVLVCTDGGDIHAFGARGFACVQHAQQQDEPVLELQSSLVPLHGREQPLHRGPGPTLDPTPVEQVDHDGHGGEADAQGEESGVHQRDVGHRRLRRAARRAR